MGTFTTGRYAAQLLGEATAVGVLTFIIGALILEGILYLANQYSSPANSYSYPRVYMYLGLFLTGFLIHLGCEATGINKWYLDNSAAAKRQHEKSREELKSLIDFDDNEKEKEKSD